MFGLSAPQSQAQHPKRPSDAPVFPHPPTDVWSCQTHDGVGGKRNRARTVFLVNTEALPALINAAGGWEELCIELTEPLPNDKILACMRTLMQVDQYWDQVPYREPTQEYVAKQIRDYIMWYVTNHGEPRKPVRITQAVNEVSEIVKEPEKQKEPVKEQEHKKPAKAKAG